MTVAVQVGNGNRLGRFDRVYSPWLEGSVAIAKQKRNRIEVRVGYDEIWFAVPIKIPNHNGACAVLVIGRIGCRGCKPAIAIAQHNSNGVKAPIQRGEIRLPISVEVADREG